MKSFSWILVIIVLLGSAPRISAQEKAAKPEQSFDEIKMLVSDGDKLKETAVRVRFDSDAMTIESKAGTTLKKILYADMKHAEYSYTKSPRWKSGMGLGAAGLAFPPLLLIAIPLGFTKHRRHWLTVRSADDYAVLKLSKSVRKVFMPAFEVKTGLDVEALGESK